MKVVVDTCVWSLALRRAGKASLNTEEQQLKGRLTDAIQDGNVVMIGPIRQEILSGIKDESQFAKTKRLLDPFLDEELLSEDYVEAARLFNLCRRHGEQCGPIDMQICSVAIRKRCLVLTNDQCLMRCLEVLRENKLLPSNRP
jgi:predicted nucleic acid-binding protein